MISMDYQPWSIPSRAADTLGRRIPEDLTVAARHNGLRAMESDPPLTALDPRLSEVAAQAVSFLLSRKGLAVPLTQSALVNSKSLNRRRANAPSPVLMRWTDPIRSVKNSVVVVAAPQDSSRTALNPSVANNRWPFPTVPLRGCVSKPPVSICLSTKCKVGNPSTHGPDRPIISTASGPRRGTRAQTCG